MDSQGQSFVLRRLFPENEERQLERFRDADDRSSEAAERAFSVPPCSWGPLSDVQPPSPFRLYRATASEHFVLITGRDLERGTASTAASR